MLRSMIDPDISKWLRWPCSWLEQWRTETASTPCEETTLLPLIVKDTDFTACCRESNYRGPQVVPGDKSKCEIDHLSFGTASGQERKGKQGTGSQEGSTPAASGQDAAHTASGQDAAPDTASNEGKVQKGSDGDEAVGSKQEPGPESQEQHGIKRTNEEIQKDELLQ